MVDVRAGKSSLVRTLLALTGALALVLGMAVPAEASTGSATARSLAGVQGRDVLVTQDAVVSAVPARWTPQVLDGAVFEIAQVGDVMVVGGSFTQIAETNTSPAIDRVGVFAFSATNGTILASFDPVIVNGDVFTVKAGPVPGTVYVGGSFTSINGVSRKLALLDVNTGDIVSGWSAPPMNGAVRDVILHNNRLYVGGTFTTVGGADHRGLVTLNATTGARQSFLDVALTENQNWTQGSTGARAAVGVKAMALSPDGRTLVVTGNFRKADGLDRRQVVLIDTSGPTAEVRTDWRTDRYSPACFSWAFDSYIRDVMMAPDGSYFTIATTGGHNNGTLCDTASTFSMTDVGTTVQPIWIADTGGDTLLSVASSGSVLYTGGHQRWMNNPLGSDYATYGAVPRPGLAALSPDNGVPIPWNPGRNPRGYGAEALTVTDAGLWVGSDTIWIGNYEYKRQRLAFFPLADGSQYMSTETQGLPANIYRSTTGSSTLSRFYYDGTSTATPVTTAPASAVPWSTVRAATIIGDTLFYVSSAGNVFARASFDGTTFGAPSTIDPYNDPTWSDVSVGGGSTRTFRGAAPTFNASDVPTLQGMFYDNGRLYYTKSGSGSITSRAFQPDSGILTQATLTVPGFSQSAIGSVFLDKDARYLYFTNTTTGTLSRVAWVAGNGYTSGTTSGSPVVVSGPAVDGRNWASTRVFPGPGPMPNQAPTAAFDVECVGADCSFDAASSSDPENGALSYSWNFGGGQSATGVSADHRFEGGGTVTVTLTVSDGELSDTETQTFDVAPGVEPVASFTVSCVELTCHVDASESADPDGDDLEFAWDFGDGQTATGPTADVSYANGGPYSIELVVTDGDGMTGTAGKDVTVSSVPAPDLVASSTALRHATYASVVLPTGIQSGDMLLLVTTLSNADDPSAPTGAGTWQIVDSAVSGGLRTITWSKLADGSESGATVRLNLPSLTKSQVTAMVYRGATEVVAAHAAFANVASHTSPTIAVPGLPATAVTIWADRSSSALTWTAPSGVDVIANEVGSAGGRVSALVVDQTVSGSSYGGSVATTSIATPRSVAVTLILTP